MKSAHGLVIGKFYPPHAGHHLLVRTAASQCDRVTVVVMAASHESIGLDMRVGWMREIHAIDANVTVTGIIDDVPVDYDDPTIWDQHVALMKAALAAISAPPVTAVFTSENYGDELARRFGARAVTLDTARLLAPVSATRVRADVPGYWTYLDPVVRGALALRVVVLGAESTGTTTLSLDLAQHIRKWGGAHGLTRWVPEYGRQYSIDKMAAATAAAQLQGLPRVAFEDVQWRSPEFVHIARQQRSMEDAEARLGGPVLVCDTDAFATHTWHERYLGVADPAVDAACGARGDLYLLTHPDGVPFEQDGIRDGEQLRTWMTQRFTERLQAMDQRGVATVPHVVLTGDRQQRLDTALQAVRLLLKKAWQFARPLG
ncbi:MAG: transcriptional regulator [Comamonadaceae bacterium]|nr:MAG: transcriptional regulator [Comamonadaceae bacterium]